MPKSEKWSNRSYSLEVRDIHNNNVLWQRKLEREQPRFAYSSAGKTITLVIANYDNIKDAAQEDSRLRAQLDSIDAKKTTYLIQPLDGMTGKPLGAVLVDTGKLSFKVERAVTAGDAVVVEDSINRTLVYSLKSGQQNGKIFGRSRAISRNGDKVLVENGAGIADVYDTLNLKALVHMTLPAAITYADFAADGNSVLILTADQHVYRVKAQDSGNAAGIE